MAERTVARLEIWDALECDGGSRIGVFPDVVRLEQTHEVSVAPRTTFEVPRSDPSWEHLKEERPVRVVYEDAPFEEYRIREIGRQIKGGERIAEVLAEGVLQDLLHNARMLERVEANGETNRHFEIYQVSPADHLSIILEGAPSYISAGTVEPGEPVDMIYHQDSPLSALQELAKVATFADGSVGAEIQLRRNGTTGYLVDLVREIGASNATLEIRDGANLVEGSQRSDSSKIGTVVHPIGGNSYGHEGTMARAAWLVSAQSGATVTFADDTLVESGQLVGKYAKLPDDSHHEITSSTAPNQITLAADPGVDLIGQRVRFRRQVDVGVYGALSYLESPASIAEWGVEKAVMLERPDLPAIDNLAPNPFMQDWASGRPDQYELIGNPTIDQNRDAFYWRTGGASAHLTGAEGEGLQTTPVQVFPSAEDPFFVAQIQIWVVSGNVRLELFDVTNDEVFPGPEFNEAITVATGRWIDSFGVAPGGTPQSNFFTRGTEHLQVRVVAARGPAEFYLDTVQMTQSQSFEEVFYGGRSSHDLWRAANDALAKVRDPEQAYDVGVVDEYRLGEVDVDTRQIALGGDAHVTDSELGIDFTTRIVKVDRDLLREAVTSITLEEKTNDLSSILVDPGRRTRRVLETPEVDCCGRGDCTNLMGGEGGGGCECLSATQASESGEPQPAQFTEKCSEDSAGDLRYFDFAAIDMAQKNLAVGDQIAWGWAGKVTPTGTAAEPGGETSDDGKLKRTATGLVKRDRFDRDTLGPDWSTPTGDWMMTEDGLYANNDGHAILTAPGAQADMVVQTSYWRGKDDLTARLYGRWQYNGGAEVGYLAEATGGSQNHRLGKDDGGRTDLATDPADLAPGWETMKLAVVGDSQRAWWNKSGVALSAADTALSAATGYLAVSVSDNGCWFEEVIWCSSNQITVTGLPTGYKVIVTGQSVADATVEDGSGTAVHDVGGMFFGFGSVFVYDDADSLVTSLTPRDGVFGGDTYLFDTSGVQEDTSGAGGIASTMGLEFIGEDGTVISSEEPQGVTTTEYTRGQATATIPGGAVKIQPYAKRVGEAQGIACIKEPQLNRGDQVCEFRKPPGEEKPATSPSAEGLIVALGLDKPADPMPWVVEASSDNPVSHPDDWPAGKQTSGFFKVPDEDGDIAYTRRVRDASGRGNHGFIYEWADWWTQENWLQRTPSLHGLGLLHPDGDDVSFPQGIISQDPDPYGTGFSDAAVADFDDLHGTTWSCWIRPWVWVDANGEVDSVAQSGDLFGRWDTMAGDPEGGGFYFQINVSVDGRPFMRVVYEDGTTDDNHTDPMIVWQCDWSFGDIGEMSGLSEGYHLMPHPIFFCLRVSDIEIEDGTIDWDIWCAKQGMACAAKVPNEAVVTDIFTGNTVLDTGHGVPPMNGSPRNQRQFAWLTRYHLDVDKDDGLMSSDGIWGLIDKCIGWGRTLNEAEINGLYKGMGDSLFGDFEFLDDDPRLLMGAPPTVSVDTCEGGTGLDVTTAWAVSDPVTDAEYDLELRYYKDGALEQTYTGVNPSTGTHTHNESNVGSDAGSTSEHGWWVEADLIRTSDNTIIETDTTMAIGITYGTC